MSPRKTHLDVWHGRLDGYKERIVQIFRDAVKDHATQAEIIDDIRNQVLTLASYGHAPRWVQEYIDGFWIGLMEGLEVTGLIVYKHCYEGRYVDYWELPVEAQKQLGVYIWAETKDIFLDPNTVDLEKGE